MKQWRCSLCSDQRVDDVWCLLVSFCHFDWPADSLLFSWFQIAKTSRVSNSRSEQQIGFMRKIRLKSTNLNGSAHVLRSPMRRSQVNQRPTRQLADQNPAAFCFTHRASEGAVIALNACASHQNNNNQNLTAAFFKNIIHRHRHQNGHVSRGEEKFTWETW